MNIRAISPIAAAAAGALALGLAAPVSAQGIDPGNQPLQPEEYRTSPPGYNAPRDERYQPGNPPRQAGQPGDDPNQTEIYGEWADDNSDLTGDRDNLDYPPEANVQRGEVDQDVEIYPETIEDAPSLAPEIPNTPPPYAGDPSVYGDFDNPQVRD